MNATDRIGNSNTGESCRYRRSLLQQLDQSILRCYEHMERIDVERFDKRIYKAEVEGARGRGQPKRRSVERVKRACRTEELQFLGK